MSALTKAGVGLTLLCTSSNINQPEAACADDPRQIRPECKRKPDCRKATTFDLKQANIFDEHQYKREHNAIPMSRFDICKCKDGSIRIAKVGMCGKPITSGTKMRILAQISIYGSQQGIDTVNKTLSGIPMYIEQIGLKKEPPEINRWHLSSPMYQFHWDERFDEEIYNFLTFYQNIKNSNLTSANEIIYSFLTICPVRESKEEDFSYILTKRTLKTLIELGLCIQVAPATVMPEFQFWCNSNHQLQLPCRKIAQQK